MELIKGKEYKRKELHDFYGGQRQGGIATPIEHPYVFIISSKRGEDHGYIDGWTNENKFFLYTGEGQNGDMEFKSGNKAIRDQQENKKKVLLFEETKKTFIELKAEEESHKLHDDDADVFEYDDDTKMDLTRDKLKREKWINNHAM